MAVTKAEAATKLGGMDMKVSSVAHKVTSFSVFRLTFVSTFELSRSNNIWLQFPFIDLDIVLLIM